MIGTEMLALAAAECRNPRKVHRLLRLGGLLTRPVGHGGFLQQLPAHSVVCRRLRRFKLFWKTKIVSVTEMDFVTGIRKIEEDARMWDEEEEEEIAKSQSVLEKVLRWFA